MKPVPELPGSNSIEGGVAGGAIWVNQLQNEEIKRISNQAPSWAQTPNFFGGNSSSAPLATPVRTGPQPFYRGSPLPPTNPSQPPAISFMSPASGGVQPTQPTLDEKSLSSLSLLAPVLNRNRQGLPGDLPTQPIQPAQPTQPLEPTGPPNDFFNQDNDFFSGVFQRAAEVSRQEQLRIAEQKRAATRARLGAQPTRTRVRRIPADYKGVLDQNLQPRGAVDVRPRQALIPGIIQRIISAATPPTEMGPVPNLGHNPLLPPPGDTIFHPLVDYTAPTPPNPGPVISTGVDPSDPTTVVPPIIDSNTSSSSDSSSSSSSSNTVVPMEESENPLVVRVEPLVITRTAPTLPAFLVGLAAGSIFVDGVYLLSGLL